MMDLVRLRAVARLAPFFALCLNLAACAGGQFSDVGSSNTYDGNVAVIEEHPFDLEAELVTSSVLSASELAEFINNRDAQSVGTDYDKMHSVVALLEGTFEQGQRILFNYRQWVDGKWYEYTRSYVIEHNPQGGAILIIGSYRITRDASVYLEIETAGDILAKHQFKVSGPNHQFGPPYSIEAGGRELSAQEVRETIAGNTFRRDEGGILTFLEDGVYLYKGERRNREGTWEVEPDGKACVSFDDGRRPCVAIYRDQSGNLKYSDDGARIWRLKRED